MPGVYCICIWEAHLTYFYLLSRLLTFFPLIPANQSVLVVQSSLTVCEPIGCSLSGSSVHGILQARVLGWVATPFSRVYLYHMFFSKLFKPEGHPSGIEGCEPFLSHLFLFTSLKSFPVLARRLMPTS